MIRGPASHVLDDRYERVEPVIARPVFPFRSAAGIVRAFFQQRDTVKAMDYSRDQIDGGSLSRDDALAHKADVIRCTVGLTEEQLRVLALAYRDGKSDLQIAERNNTSQRTICRKRNEALRHVRGKAVDLELIPPEIA